MASGSFAFGLFDRWKLDDRGFTAYERSFARASTAPMSDDEIPSPKPSPKPSLERSPEPKPDAPALSPAKLAEKQRLARALRENLKRRKAQARGRIAESAGNSGPTDE